MDRKYTLWFACSVLKKVQHAAMVILTATSLKRELDTYSMFALLLDYLKKLETHYNFYRKLRIVEYA